MPTSFTEKQLRISFQLAKGSTPSTFPGTGTNTATLSGLRASARILKAGYPSMGSCELAVWGVQPDVYNTVSTLGAKIMLVPNRNFVTVEADSGQGFTKVYIGQIYNAWPDFTAAPDVPLRISSQVSAGDAATVANALSTKVPTPAATILNSIATQLNLGFENSGVDTILPPSYFWGDLWSQAGQVAKACRVDLTVDLGNLIIYPRNGTRNTSPIPLISPETGMIGYPSYSAEGLHLETIFNPSVAFQGLVQVKSSLPRASGQWGVFRLSHELDAQLPGGQWKSSMDLFNPAYGIPIPTNAGP